jgi:hypothetical protein
LPGNRPLRAATSNEKLKTWEKSSLTKKGVCTSPLSTATVSHLSFSVRKRGRGGWREVAVEAEHSASGWKMDACIHFSLFPFPLVRPSVFFLSFLSLSLSTSLTSLTLELSLP